MQWITCKRATSMGEEIPVGTRGEGEVPAHLVGKVQVLITATPAEPAEAEKPADEVEAAEAEKPARRSRS